MHRPPTPGAYIKHRRTARGLAIDDVAGKLPTEPHIRPDERAQWLRLIEADVVPMRFGTIVALHDAIGFDLAVLARLTAIHRGEDVALPPLCRICSCSQHDACATPAPCGWVADDLCSSCAGTGAGTTLVQVA